MSCYDQKNEEVCKRTTFFIHGEYILDCCREMFHYDCLLDWLQEHNCCPVCFKEVSCNTRKEIEKECHDSYNRDNPDTPK